MTNPTVTDQSAAALVARFLKARGVDRVFALCGGHIMPIWMRLDAEGHPHRRRARRARRRLHGACACRADRRPRGGAGHRRPRRHQCDDRHRQCPRGARAGAGPVGHAAAGAGEPRRAAGHGAHRVRAPADPLRAHRARADRWCCRSSTRRWRARSARAASPGRSTSTFRSTRCAPRCRGRCSCPSCLRRGRSGACCPIPTRCAQAVELLWSAKRPLVISGRGARGAAGAAARTARPRSARCTSTPARAAAWSPRTILRSSPRCAAR